MMRRLQVILFTVFLFQFEIAFTQPTRLASKNIVFDQLPEEIGVNQRTVNDIIQDSQGYIWIATWSGLIKYDGQRSSIYLSDREGSNRLRSNKITSLAEDGNGFIWIGTRVEGLFRLDPKSEQFYQYKADTSNNSISDNNVWDVAIGDGGDIWIATEKGLNRFGEDGVFHAYNSKDGISDDFVRSIHIDKRNNIWLTTENGINKISSLNPFKVQSIYYTEDLSNYSLHNYYYEIEEIDNSKSESLYFTSKKGLKWWDGKTLRNFSIPEKDNSFSFFRSILSVGDDNEDLLLLGSEKGLHFFNPTDKAFIGFLGNYDPKTNLSHNTVTKIFLDGSAVLWVGTRKGINRYDTFDKGFRLYNNYYYDSQRNILTGIKGDNKDVWLSTIGGGVFRFEPENEKFTQFQIGSNSDNDFSKFVQSLHVCNKGKVFLGTAGGGVYVFDPNDPENTGGTVHRYKQYFNDKNATLSDDYIMSITSSKDGGIWVGTWSGGLNKIKEDGTVIKYIHPPFTDAPVVELLEVNNTLWVGSRGNGVYKIDIENNELSDPIKFKNGTKYPISSNFISSIYEDSFGSIWIGTEDGLNLYDDNEKRFKSYFKKDGLITNESISILEDNSRNLWVSHWKGVTVIRPGRDSLSILNTFDEQDRIQGGFFYSGVAYKDKFGKLYFGGSNGFNVIDPSAVKSNPYQPKIAITSLKIFNNEVKPGGKLNGRVITENLINRTEKIELKHDENSLLLEFSALHFAAPEKNKYTYILKGFDSEWRYTDQTRSFATYTNLPKGEYQFLIKASNNDGIWMDETKSISITVLPPWWLTFPAFILYALIIVGLLYGFRRLIITRTNYENNLEIERLEKNNLEKNNKAKLQFFTNVSHEFRTPLTLILGPLERMMSHTENSKFLTEQLNIINSNTQRLLRLVNQLLDFRKVESGNMELRVAEGNLVKFTKEIKLSFQGLAEEKNISFNLYASSNVVNVYFDRDQFEKIIFNILSNAFKHTQEKGEITIKILETKSGVSLIVNDNGEGIKAKNLDKVFDRFYSGDDDYITSTGIGLALVKSLVKLHDGEISLESEIDQGTTITINLKKGHQHFTEEQIISNFKDSEFIGHYTVLNSGISDSIVQNNEKDLVDKETILVVEDNEEVRKYIKSIFIEDYIVLEAKNGEEGIEVATEEAPDIILSDVMMPIMDGINFCKKIKSSIKTSHIPVILLTARTSLIFQIEGFENGADDYILKPFNSEILKFKVKNLIAQRNNIKTKFKESKKLNIEPSEISFTSSDEIFINKILESIEKHMSESEFTVEDLGKDIGLSRMQLYRKLKSLTGQSANEFVRTIRLKRAAQLLDTGEYNVADVTYMCGFTDLQYFRKCFKKHFGVNPSEFGKKSKMEIED